MPVSQFPSSLPAPKLRGYRRRLLSNQGKQQFLNQGRYYRRTRGSPVIDSVTFRCDKSQRETLWQMYLSQQGHAFEILLPCGTSREPQQAQFYSDLTEACIDQHWEISVELLIQHPPMIAADALTEQFLDFMNIADGRFADPLKTFIHTEWPTYE